MSAVYRHLEDNWLCHPQSATDRCTASPEATEIEADNSLTPVPAASERSDKLDCFYVYPSLDVQSPAGLVKDYANIDDIWEAARQQALPFADTCRIYAPLYHQVTINSYLDATRDELLEQAYAEVDDAFRHYLAQDNGGRDIAFIGHSQGTHMLRRLLQRHFDGPDNELLRGRLAAALLLGDIGDVAVPTGELVGGTFKDIPLCSEVGERGCIVAYNSFPPSAPPSPLFGLFVGGIPEGMEAGCTNPAAFRSGKVPSAGAYFPSIPKSTARGAVSNLHEELGVDTYFSVMRQFHSLECKRTATGQHYLEVGVVGDASDARTDPIQYASEELNVALVGLHILDFNLGLADLVELVRAHAQ